jgi:hypothetical protein
MPGGITMDGLLGVAGMTLRISDELDQKPDNSRRKTHQ